MAVKLEGILPVLPTPYLKNGEVDLDAMESVAQFCVDAGASALVFPGVASEFDFLSSDERMALMRVVCGVAQGRLPVVCSGGAGEASAIGADILKSQQLGAEAAMVLIPRQFQDDEDGALRFILSVIENAPGVDIVLQNAPNPVGAGLGAAALMRIVEATDAIRYVKEETLPSGPKITELRNSAPKHLRGIIGGGGARYVIDEMNRGAVAAMPAAEITDIHVDMWNAYQNGDEAKARELYRESLPLLIIQLIYRMRLTKSVLTKRGIFSNSIVRAPLPEFDAYDEAELEAQLNRLSQYFKIAPAKVAAA